jgi:transposase-like protein
MASPGHPYTPEFHAEAVRLLRSGGKTVAELSRELGVSEATLRRWRQQAEEDAPEPTHPTNDRGKDRFMRTLAKLTAEVIETGVAVVTLPAKWAASGLRWYADHNAEPRGRAPEGQDRKRGS